MLNKRSRQIFLYDTGLLLFVLLCMRACQPANTENVIEDFIAAVNAGDVNAEMSFIAEDAVITYIPPPIPGDDGIFSGKRQIRRWFQQMSAENGYCETSNVTVDGKQYTALLRWRDDSLKEIGLDHLDCIWVATVKNGKIQGYTATLTDDSLSELTSLLHAAQAE